MTNAPIKYPNISELLKHETGILSKGPVGVVLLEDDVEVISTILHTCDAGFAHVIVIGVEALLPSEQIAPNVSYIVHDMMSEHALVSVMNPIIEAATGQWCYYCYNSEYLFHPFSETRNVAELLAFNTEERRNTILTYVIDLYAGDLEKTPNAVDLKDAYLDRNGYYALARYQEPDGYLERQLDIFGGLRWRFEQFVPYERRRIDRVALFRAKPKLQLRADHSFNDPEYNTYSCPWHHNLTAAICSFRTAKALCHIPGSAKEIDTFIWKNAVPFEWRAQQLMDLGMIEPGQWF
jgi:hypothetical protein